MRKCSIIRMIAAPFEYDIVSNISEISSGWLTGSEILWEDSSPSTCKRDVRWLNNQGKFDKLAYLVNLVT